MPACEGELEVPDPRRAAGGVPLTVRLVDTPARQRSPRELLFEFLRGHDRFRCELVDHGAYGVEAQFLRNEEFEYSRRFDPRLNLDRTPREMAIAWAEEERKALERDLSSGSVDGA